ncbi:MAG: guanylate kinase [Verrucomicrobiota bacterium]|nr:guanylate kinase [Verrucomicrobiota bacterium]
MNKKKRGLVFVLSAPAGTGKTTLARMLAKEFPSLVLSVSSTTRPSRSFEQEGRDYHFLSREEFEKQILAGEFLEYAEVFGNYYGTSKKSLEKMRSSGKHVLLVIDTQGALQLKERIDAVYIFIAPPNFQELQRRLEARESESGEEIQKRLSWAHQEMAEIDQYDYLIVNDTLDNAYAVLRSILIAEEHRVYAKTH